MTNRNGGSGMIRRIVTAYWVIRILLAEESVRADVVRLLSLAALACSSALWLFVTALGVIFDLPGTAAEATSVAMWVSAVVYCAAV